MFELGKGRAAQGCSFEACEMAVLKSLTWRGGELTYHGARAGFCSLGCWRRAQLMISGNC
jgi:hypothetical protein